MLPRHLRLPGASVSRLLSRQAPVFAGGSLLLVAAHPAAAWGVAVVVGKKYHNNATERNLLRRRVAALARPLLPLQGAAPHALIIMVKKGVRPPVPWALLRAELPGLLQRLRQRMR